ncbi:MAG: transcription antitermination factor NusB [Actinomycetaceae bacterium]|nr:transcription antitermination factor NusB [Actinomycetaceae bacterium]
MNYRAKRWYVDSARELAVEILVAVDEDDAYANLLLPARLRQRNLRGRDAAFCTELTYGTLRDRDRIDTILSVVSTRPVPQLDPWVRNICRVGAHQLLNMRVPAHAAVAEMVDIARLRTSTGPAQMVNAVLRRVSESTSQQWNQTITEGLSEIDRLALVTSHPRWIVRALEESAAAYGRANELPRILRANNDAPYVNLVARPGLIDREELADIAEEQLRTRVAYSPISPWGLIIEGGNPGRLAPVRQGAAAVQDAGSQLVAALVVGAKPIVAGEKWLDMCAGPGGKAALLGALGKQNSATVLANEISEHRAELVRKATAGLNMEVICEDGRELSGSYDRILIDAPCTGLGALRRRPEARYRKSPQDLAELTELQRGLCYRGTQLVKPGGIVVYSTCSPHLSETNMIVSEILSKCPEMQLLDAAQIARQFTSAEIGSGPLLQLWPDRDGTDGMFMVVLQKKN